MQFLLAFLHTSLAAGVVWFHLGDFEEVLVNLEQIDSRRIRFGVHLSFQLWAASPNKCWSLSDVQKDWDHCSISLFTFPNPEGEKSECGVL